MGTLKTLFSWQISHKTGTQKKKFLNEKTWPMLFFDICETPIKFWPHFFKCDDASVHPPTQIYFTVCLPTPGGCVSFEAKSSIVTPTTKYILLNL